MNRRVIGTTVILAALVTPLVGCSEEQDVTASVPPLYTQPPTPSVPSKPSLVRYVSPTGDDHNPGTIQRPWRTLSYALNRLFINQVLYVRGGTYRERIDHVRLHPGKPGSPITVLAYPGEDPVVLGSVSLRRPAYWRIDNLDVRGDPRVPATKQPSFMVKIIGGSRWTWQNSEFSNTTGRANVLITGWGFSEPAAFKFRGNCLHALPTPPQGSTNLFLGRMQSGAHGTVSRNVIFNHSGQPNVRIGSGAGAAERVTLFSNTIYGGSLGIDVRGRPHKVTISRNLIGGGSAAAEIKLPRGVPQGMKVINNIAVDTAQLFRPKVRKRVHSYRDRVHGYGNIQMQGDSDFVDTTRCDGFRSDAGALIPYGAFAP